MDRHVETAASAAPRETILGYDLVRCPSEALLERVFRLRTRAWRARASRFPESLDVWEDVFDAHSMHFIACLPDATPVAAARLTVTDAIENGPDAETYKAVPREQYEPPIGFISRLVVCPAHARKGLSRALDESRLLEARKLGCKTILAHTHSGERRIRQLETYGFVRLHVANVQAPGPLANIGAPTILALRLE